MSVRRLRPAHIVASGDTVWLVDESWPAAAALRLGDVQLVFWRDGAVRGMDHLRPVADGGGGIVVQDATAVTWVGVKQSSVLIDFYDLKLSAADTELAWLVDNGTPPYEIPGMPDSVGRRARADEASSGPGGRIVALKPYGTRTEIATRLPVRDVEVDGDDVVVVFAERPVPHQDDYGWLIEYPTSQLRTSRAELLAGVLTVSPSPRPGWPPYFAPDEVDFDSVDDDRVRWAWLESKVRTVLRHGVRATGLVWWAGADPEGDRINRRVLVRGHDPDTGRVVTALDAGLGLVITVRAVADELWIAIARQRFLAVPRSRGVEVVAVSRSGAVRTIYEPDSIDISVADPPLRPRPSDAEIEAAIDELRSELDQVDTHVDGVRDPSVTVEGVWPETTVAVTLRHPSRPGLLLRRTYPVFDDRGHPVSHNVVDGLMEQLGTGHIAPADEAIDGVLEI